MPSIRHNSLTLMPWVGLSTPETASSRFGLLQEMIAEGNAWDSDPSTEYFEYKYISDSEYNPIGSSMLASILTVEPRTKQNGKRKKNPSPKQNLRLWG